MIRAAFAVKDLAEAFGKKLAPYFMASANLATRFAEGLAHLPAPVLEIAAAIAFTTVSFTALGLALPAVKLALESLANGFTLMKTVILTVIAAVRDLMIAIYNIPATFKLAVDAVIALRDALVGLDIAALVATAPLWAVEVAVAAISAAVIEAMRGFKDLRDMWNWLKSAVTGFLFPKPPDVKIPEPDWGGLGGAEKDAGADNWLKAHEAAVDEFLAHYQLGVEKAQAQLAVATSRKESYSSTLDPNEYRTLEEARKQQQLISDELRAQQTVAAALTAQRDAQLQAAQKYLALEKQLPQTDKDRATHMAELAKKATEAQIAATKITAELAKMSPEVVKAANAISSVFRQAFSDVGDQLARQITNGFDAAKMHIEGQILSIQTRQRMRQAGGGSDSGVEDAQDALAIAQKRAAEANNELNKEQALWNKHA
ncbi:MAG: hypothetical protein ACREJX_13260, partial [Polyangiaceae bacterium]